MFIVRKYSKYKKRYKINFKKDGCLKHQDKTRKSLVSPAKTENKMEGRFFLDIVIRKSTSIFKLFSSKDKTLLIWRDSFFILDLSFYIFNGIRTFNFKGDSFAGKGLDEDLHGCGNKLYGQLK
uniref:Uncharacterized protein n=1 Tax=Panagrolaimus sp. ES5 TaxID=591445 RepID=A0AC34GU41_9BILA